MQTNFLPTSVLLLFFLLCTCLFSVDAKSLSHPRIPTASTRAGTVAAAPATRHVADGTEPLYNLTKWVADGPGSTCTNHGSVLLLAGSACQYNPYTYEMTGIEGADYFIGYMSEDKGMLQFQTYTDSTCEVAVSGGELGNKIQSCLNGDPNSSGVTFLAVDATSRPGPPPPDFPPAGFLAQFNCPSDEGCESTSSTYASLLPLNVCAQSQSIDVVHTSIVSCEGNSSTTYTQTNFQLPAGSAPQCSDPDAIVSVQTVVAKSGDMTWFDECPSESSPMPPVFPPSAGYVTIKSYSIGHCVDWALMETDTFPLLKCSIDAQGTASVQYNCNTTHSLVSLYQNAACSGSPYNVIAYPQGICTGETHVSCVDASSVELQ